VTGCVYLVLCDLLNFIINIRVISALGHADQIIVMGDLNLVHISWIPCDDSNLLLPNICHDFTDGITDKSLAQISSVKNNRNRPHVR